MFLIEIVFVISVGTAREFCNRQASLFNLSFERAAIATFAPFLANNFAVASPIPSDAPVIMTTLFLISIDSILS